MAKSSENLSLAFELFTSRQKLTHDLNLLLRGNWAPLPVGLLSLI